MALNRKHFRRRRGGRFKEPNGARLSKIRARADQHWGGRSSGSGAEPRAPDVGENIALVGLGNDANRHQATPNPPDARVPIDRMDASNSYRTVASPPLA